MNYFALHAVLNLAIDHGIQQTVLPYRGLLRGHQTGLRSLMVFITLVRVTSLWVGEERKQSQAEIQIAEQFRKQGAQIALGGPYDLLDRHWPIKPQDKWRNLAHYMLGERPLKINSRVKVIKNLKPLAEFKSLHTLVLDSRLKNLKPLSKLNTLLSLNLAGNPVKDLRPLAQLTNLQWLYLYVTPVEDISPLAGMKNLEMLDLKHTQVSDITPIAGMKNLQRLYLTHTNIDDLTPLAGLTNLDILDVNETQVSDLTPLVGLKKLTKIDVRSTNVTKEQVLMLKKALPNCKFFNDPFPQ